MKTMKICPTCQQQYPNGFQYCPNDTELLVQSDDYFRRTQTLEAVPNMPPPTPVTPAVTKSVEPPSPAPRQANAERQIQPVIETPTPTPYRQAEPAHRQAEPAHRQVEPPRPSAPTEPIRSTGNGPKTTNLSASAPTAPAVPNGGPNKGKAAVTPRADAPGMAFAMLDQGNVFKGITEGFGQFFKYLGKAPKGQNISEFVDQESILKRISNGFSLYFKYLGKPPQASDSRLLLPESGNIVQRLKESGRIFVDNFGKKAPELKPGEMGLLDDEPIYTRVGRELKLAASDFRRNPRAFVVSVLKGDGSTKRRQQFLQAGVAMAMIAYAFIFTSFLLAGLFRFGGTEKPAEEKIELTAMIAPPTVDVKVKEPPKDVPKGKGGFTGGSKPKPQQAHGGGGGGREQLTPPSKGVLPQAALTPQIVPPNPEPPKIKNPTLPVASTIYADPNALPQLKGPIGAPNGAPIPPSSGPGSGDGIGTNRGSGVGPGEGAGAGPGRGGNVGGGDNSLGGGRGPGGSGGIESMGQNGVGRIQILYKEKAKYTEEARQNKVQGTVVLSAIFTSDGGINSIRVIRGLPDGLTEKAIEAAKKIRFKPAEKNGAPVTVRGQLEFTFNLY
jgi:TonB family protein